MLFIHGADRPLGLNRAKWWSGPGPAAGFALEKFEIVLVAPQFKTKLVIPLIKIVKIQAQTPAVIAVSACSQPKFGFGDSVLEIVEFPPCPIDRIGGVVIVAKGGIDLRRADPLIALTGKAGGKGVLRKAIGFQPLGAAGKIPLLVDMHPILGAGADMGVQAAGGLARLAIGHAEAVPIPPEALLLIEAGTTA